MRPYPLEYKRLSRIAGATAVREIGRDDQHDEGNERRGEDLAAEASKYGDRLAGTILNRVPQYRQHEAVESVIPALEEAGAKPLGWLPEDRRLIAPTLNAVAKNQISRPARSEGL